MEETARVRMSREKAATTTASPPPAGPSDHADVQSASPPPQSQNRLQNGAVAAPGMQTTGDNREPQAGATSLPRWYLQRERGQAPALALLSLLSLPVLTQNRRPGAAPEHRHLRNTSAAQLRATEPWKSLDPGRRALRGWAKGRPPPWSPELRARRERGGSDAGLQPRYAVTSIASVTSASSHSSALATWSCSTTELPFLAVHILCAMELLPFTLPTRQASH